MMRLTQLFVIVTAVSSYSFVPNRPTASRLNSRSQTVLYESNSNTDMFSSAPKESGDSSVAQTAVLDPPSESGKKDEKTNRTTAKYSNLMDEAARLRKEAAEMEVSLREEARAKGLPEEMINKLVPLTSNQPKKAKKTEEEKKIDAAAGIPEKKFAAPEIRKKLGYLNSGDAIRFTSELDRIKGKGLLTEWNSREVTDSNFAVNNLQLKSKTNINPVDLKLDDVGYNYQIIFGIALLTATVCALGSNFIGGQIGFLLGYLSALAPIALVGIGSIAPGLLGDIINGAKFAVNSDARDRYVRLNAGKFMVGYVLGLPVERFSTSGSSNTVEFFQVRPSGKTMTVEEKQMFARNQFKQQDVARSSAVCIAGNVAECMTYGEASGTNANDVNTLYELINAVNPPLEPERVQDHIRWSAVTAHSILSERPGQLEAMCKAFADKLPLEECIAILESKDSVQK
mmetsp:Transcript_25813/g.43064  ORF Transcript_25813/g.43064 Transcript_25813/m.43064 type:complete len:456 (+) Transcript_25813:97-1464(+)